MKPTDGELMAAATLVRALYSHECQDIPRKRAYEHVMSRFYQVLDDIQTNAPAERADFRAVVQAARHEDIQ